MEPQVIEWEQGLSYMQRGISKLKRIIQGFYMCTKKPPCDYSQQLYGKYRETFEDYINSTVLPSLKEKLDEFMLQEIVKSWENHKVMVRWMSRFFHYLDRYFIVDRSLRPLNEVGLNYFRDLVYREIKVNTRVVLIGFINKEREGEQIDRTLLKNVINIFVEIGMEQMDAYKENFEAHMLTDTEKYYSRKATSWISEDPKTDYMLKVEECLRMERDRVSHYPHPSSAQMLVEKVEHELLTVYVTDQLQHSTKPIPNVIMYLS